MQYLPLFSILVTMKHLYFVRHALSLMNEQGIFSGVTETPLTETGRQQAVDAGQQLKEIGIDCIVSSPVTRALDTARIIAEQIGYDPTRIIINNYFTERDFGPLEGTTYKPGMDLDSVEGVEHSTALIQRVNEGWKELQGIDADTILVVSHGSAGRALRSIVQEETPFHGSEQFGNAQVVKLL